MDEILGPIPMGCLVPIGWCPLLNLPWSIGLRYLLSPGGLLVPVPWKGISSGLGLVAPDRSVVARVRSNLGWNFFPTLSFRREGA